MRLNWFKNNLLDLIVSLVFIFIAPAFLLGVSWGGLLFRNNNFFVCGGSWLLIALVLLRIIRGWSGNRQFLGLVLFLTYGIALSGVYAIWSEGVSLAEMLSPPPRQAPEIIEAMSQVCEGEGVEEADAYLYPYDVHPIVYISTREMFIPEDWQSKSVEDTELVVCVDYKKEVHKSCQSVRKRPSTKYIHKAYVRVFVAQTGKLLRKFELAGTKPSECTGWLGIDWGLGNEGGHVKESAIRARIERFVNLQD